MAVEHFTAYNNRPHAVWHEYATASVSFRDNGLMGRKSKAVSCASVPFGTMSSAFTTTPVHITDGLLGVCDLLDGAPKVRWHACVSGPILFVKINILHLTSPNCLLRVWWVVPPGRRAKFEEIMAKVLNLQNDKPKLIALLRSKSVYPVLSHQQYKYIGVNRVVQHSGQVEITCPVSGTRV